MEPLKIKARCTTGPTSTERHFTQIMFLILILSTVNHYIFGYKE
jgi:hypothetical protein